MSLRYRVDLSEAEHIELTTLLNGGKHAARKLKRAQIPLAADAGVSDEVIASSVSVGVSTVYRTRRRFVRGNLDLVLSEQARPGASRKLSGKGAYQEFCVRGHSEARFGLGETHDHTERTD